MISYGFVYLSSEIFSGMVVDIAAYLWLTDSFLSPHSCFISPFIFSFYPLKIYYHLQWDFFVALLVDRKKDIKKQRYTKMCISALHFISLVLFRVPQENGLQDIFYTPQFPHYISQCRFRLRYAPAQIVS